jgi:hypothetical protein
MGKKSSFVCARDVLNSCTCGLSVSANKKKKQQISQYSFHWFCARPLQRTYHNMHHGVMGGFALKAAAADAFQVCHLSTCPKTVVFLTPDAYHIRM